jgi:hypothetical protein
VIVYRGDSPAVVRVGGHGYDGSTFTEVQIDAWRGAPCSVVLATTLSAGQLYFLATSNGTACSGLALLVTFSYLWGRVGTAANGSSPLHVQATAPGFSPVNLFATQPSIHFPNASAPGSPCFALALQDGGAVGYSSGSPVAPAAMAASIAVARAAHAQRRARFPGDLADAYDAQQSILAWNSMFTPYEGVVTPVSRGWNHGAGYVLFCWDNLFLAWQASLEADSKDLAYSNLIQIVQARTAPGFVPNYHSGTHDATDRSEPQIGALMTLQVYTRFQEAWVVEKLFDTLLGWAEWVWSQRTAPTPSGGLLVVLGSDRNFPRDEPNTGTLEAATLESGIDNGAAYEDLTAQDWDAGKLRMRQFDVGASALFAAECEALIELAGVVGRSDVVPLLSARRAAIASAMNATLWNEAEGVYENTLANVSEGAGQASRPVGRSFLTLVTSRNSSHALSLPHPMLFLPAPPPHARTPGHLSQAPHAHGLLPHDQRPPHPRARHRHAAPAHLPARLLRQHQRLRRGQCQQHHAAAAEWAGGQRAHAVRQRRLPGRGAERAEPLCAGRGPGAGARQRGQQRRAAGAVGERRHGGARHSGRGGGGQQQPPAAGLCEGARGGRVLQQRGASRGGARAAGAVAGGHGRGQRLSHLRWQPRLPQRGSCQWLRRGEQQHVLGLQWH